MRFSLWCSSYRPWPELLAEATTAEARGWDGIWLADHFLPRDEGYPWPQEALTFLAGIAAAVPRVRVGPLVLGNTYRHPAVVAKIAQAMDAVSGGRFVLGVGAGWQQNEHDAFGIELPPVRARLDRFETACEILRRLLDGETVDIDRAGYRVSGAVLGPRPVGRVPLLIGASGERRMPGIVARWADEWNHWGTPETHAHKAKVMSAACEAIGRDPATLVRSVQVLLFISEDPAELARCRQQRPPHPMLVGTPDEIGEALHAYADAGLDEFVVTDRNLGTGAQRQDALDLFLERIAAPFRDPA